MAKVVKSGKAIAAGKQAITSKGELFDTSKETEENLASSVRNLDYKEQSLEESEKQRKIQANLSMASAVLSTVSMGANMAKSGTDAVKGLEAVGGEQVKVGGSGLSLESTAPTTKFGSAVKGVKDFLGIGYGADKQFNIRADDGSIKTYTGQELSTIGSMEGKLNPYTGEKFDKSKFGTPTTDKFNTQFDKEVSRRSTAVDKTLGNYVTPTEDQKYGMNIDPFKGFGANDATSETVEAGNLTDVNGEPLTVAGALDTNKTGQTGIDTATDTSDVVSDSTVSSDFNPDTASDAEIRAMQDNLGVEVDGEWGEESIQAFADANTPAGDAIVSNEEELIEGGGRDSATEELESRAVGKGDSDTGTGGDSKYIDPDKGTGAGIVEGEPLSASLDKAETKSKTISDKGERNVTDADTKHEKKSEAQIQNQETIKTDTDSATGDIETQGVKKPNEEKVVEPKESLSSRIGKKLTDDKGIFQGGQKGEKFGRLKDLFRNKNKVTGKVMSKEEETKYINRNQSKRTGSFDDMGARMHRDPEFAEYMAASNPEMYKKYEKDSKDPSSNMYKQIKFRENMVPGIKYDGISRTPKTKEGLNKHFANAKDGGYSLGLNRYSRSTAYSDLRDDIRNGKDGYLKLEKGTKEHKEGVFKEFQAVLDATIADDRFDEAAKAEMRLELEAEGKGGYDADGNWSTTSGATMANPASAEMKKKQSQKYKAMKDNWEQRYKDMVSD